MNSLNKQDTRVVLVTGGARRIGAAIVRLLHHHGYHVVIHCRHAIQEADILALELNNKRKDSAYVLQKELTHDLAPQEVIEELLQWSGRLDLLVNNASIFIRTDHQHSNQHDWQNLFDIHVKVPFLLSHAARPSLEKHSGSIINITDIHAEKPLKGYSVYCQSKAALKMQTESLAREFAPHIRVNAIAPGAILWPEDANTLTREAQQQIIEKTPLKRHGTPECIAEAVWAVAKNAFITGQTLRVDGGRSI